MVPGDLSDLVCAEAFGVAGEICLSAETSADLGMGRMRQMTIKTLRSMNSAFSVIDSAAEGEASSRIDELDRNSSKRHSSERISVCEDVPASDPSSLVSAVATSWEGDRRYMTSLRNVCGVSEHSLCATHCFNLEA